MRVADDDIVLLAGVDHALHLLQQLRILVLARNAKLLAEIAFADQDRADALHLLEHRVEVLDAAHVLDLQDREDLAVRIERPHVGLRVILLLRQAPVAHRAVRAVAADAGRLVVLRGLEPRIAARRDRVVGLLDGRDVRKHDAVAAEIERLLRLPLRLLDAVHRHAHHRRHGRARCCRAFTIWPRLSSIAARRAAPCRPTDCAPSPTRRRRTWSTGSRTRSLISAGWKHVKAGRPASSARITPLRRRSAIPFPLHCDLRLRIVSERIRNLTIIGERTQ